MAALICVPLAAQPPIQTEPTVITVTGQATPLSQSAASVVVVPRPELASREATGIADILRPLPFLYLTQSGGTGGLTTVTIRGGKPNFTQVMFDGIPLNDITNTLGGSYDFAHSATTGVEQIEIVRGPLSAVYGSDAVAGVINILPRTGEGRPTLEIGVSGGSFATKQSDASASVAFRKFDIAASGSWLDLGEQVLKDPFRLGTVNLHPRLLLGPGKSLSITVRYQNSDSAGFPINGGGPERSILRDPQSLQSREWIAGARWGQQISAAWRYEFDLDAYLRDEDSRIPAILDAISPSFSSVPSQVGRTAFRRVRTGASSSHTWGAHWSLEFGGGWRHEAGDSDSVLAGVIPDMFQQTRDMGSGNAVLSYHGSRLTAVASGRIDGGAGFRTVYTPRASGIYRLNSHGLALKASWGRGFKLPSFYAVANSLIGNPGLRPEFSESLEAGVEAPFARGRAHVELTLFRNRYRDLVDFSAAQFRLVNRSDVRTKGAELAVRAKLHRTVEVGAFASYLDWELQDTTEPLRTQPHWRAGADLQWNPTAKLQAHVDALWVGRRYDFSVPVPEQLTAGGYAVTNVALSDQFSRRVTGFLRVDNLLDRRFHEFIGFPNPGVSIRVGIRVSFL